MDNNTLDISKIPIEHHFAIPFFEFVSKDFDLDTETITMISKHCELVNYEKGSHLLHAGSDCRFIHFIISGEGISYFTNHSGKTTTWFFHFNKPESSVKNAFAVDYKSFLSGESATVSIEALSDITSIRFSREQVRFLSDNSMIFERWIRIINERAFIMIYDRISTLLTLSATERYKKFLKDEPYLLNMFNNYYIASYLDVAPQSLSRIRKNI
ncbi:Crp/Fnr family transcriptional regulator [Flavobacterium sp. P21]|uniref:Crp/Fnr family transcriptional regulator n=1 Tax=Flavobacterium sp. P21 TaxID=3423948 RepID=UPI003D672B09